MAEDVEIKVKQTAEGNSLAQAGAQVEALRKRIEDLRKAADAYGQKGLVGAEQTARQDARALERDLAALTRQRAQGEKEITQERRQQDAVARAQGGGGGGGLAIGARGVLRAAAVGQLIEAIVTDAFERGGIQNRVAARVASGNRQVGLLGTFRGSDSAAFGQAEGLRAEIFQRENDRPELARRKKQGIFDSAISGGSYGAGIGFVAGSAVPGVGNVLGAGIGFGIGAVTGGIKGYLSGDRAEKENLEQKKAAEAQLKATDEKNRELFKIGTGQDIAQQRAQIAGRYQEALAIGQASAAYKRYQEVRSRLPDSTPEDKKESDRIAKEAADLTIQESARQQTRAASGAIGARTSGAASARWAGIASGQAGINGDEARNILKQIHGKMDDVRDKDFTKR